MTKHDSVITIVLALALAAAPIAAQAVGVSGDAQLVKDVHPTLASGPLASAKLVNLPAGTILRSGELQITQKDLDAEIRKAPSELRPQLKRNLFFVLESKVTQMLLQYEAEEWAKRNKSAADAQDDPIERYLASLTADLSATDDDAKAFYEKNKDMVGDATFDQIKDQIKQYLVDQKRQEAVNSHIAAAGERYQIDVDKTWTAKQNSAAMDNPIDKARQSGKPTMVDLGADGCRPCDMMTPILEELKKAYAGKVNILFVHVRKEQVLAARYGVQSIPVQIFFDKDGREVFRHVGFFPNDQITAKLAEMGVK